jgi:phosphoribosylamine---glycine ligase
VLAAGKGVIIAKSEAEAREAIDSFFVDRRFGRTRVVIEEFLEGEELSLLALCDGLTAVPMAPAQDYKRIFDGDEGPNTGGMGSYSPVPGIGSDHAEVLARAVHQPIVDELRARGTPFHGVLYAGLMTTADGPKVLEYNARFGDPETQVLMPRLGSDLAELALACAEGNLQAYRALLRPEACVTVVLASGRYPEPSETGFEISGLRDAADIDGGLVFHAGTAERHGRVVTAGGRVLSVSGTGGTIATARERAYEAVARISFEGMRHRTDIAARAAEEERA